MRLVLNLTGHEEIQVQLNLHEIESALEDALTLVRTVEG
jgi:hypothetical protein